jgi:hypothetical protein
MGTDLTSKIQSKFPKYKQRMVSLMLETVNDNGKKILQELLDILKYKHDCNKFSINYNEKNNKYEILIKDKMNNNFKKHFDNLNKKFNMDMDRYVFVFGKEGI